VTIEDGEFTVDYTVTNIGIGTAEESTTCKYVDGELKESQECPALGSGESHTGTFEPEPCPGGATLNVTVCADNDDVVVESDETNNCEVNIVECPEEEKPDLEIEKSVTIEDGEFTVDYTVTPAHLSQSLAQVVRP
jgi:subtilase family serine protease